MERFKKSISYPSALHQPLMHCMIDDGFSELTTYMTYLFEQRVAKDGIDINTLYGNTGVETEIKPVETLSAPEPTNIPPVKVWGVKSSKK